MDLVPQPHQKRQRTYSDNEYLYAHTAEWNTQAGRQHISRWGSQSGGTEKQQDMRGMQNSNVLGTTRRIKTICKKNSQMYRLRFIPTRKDKSIRNHTPTATIPASPLYDLGQQQQVLPPTEKTRYYICSSRHRQQDDSDPSAHWSHLEEEPGCTRKRHQVGIQNITRTPSSLMCSDRDDEILIHPGDSSPHSKCGIMLPTWNSNNGISSGKSCIQSHECCDDDNCGYRKYSHYSHSQYHIKVPEGLPTMAVSIVASNMDQNFGLSGFCATTVEIPFILWPRFTQQGWDSAFTITIGEGWIPPSLPTCDPNKDTQPGLNRLEHSGTPLTMNVWLFGRREIKPMFGASFAKPFEMRCLCIVSALSSKVSVHAHVVTQLPYALLCALVSVLVGYLPLGFEAYPSWAGLLIGIPILAASIFLLGAKTESTHADAFTKILLLLPLPASYKASLREDQSYVDSLESPPVYPNHHQDSRQSLDERQVTVVESDEIKVDKSAPTTKSS
ncbi:hypothetical protein DFS34DRAFT_593609 [Phlyctochytrium arcticum]|nr:hypothetical protein DFS34DRAFT_593609 [Phlyctochytrium arcticum]